jgi:hypothetical protein
MKRPRSQIRAACLLWLVLPIFAFASATAQAADINFKNNTQLVVKVQGAAYLNKQKTITKAGKVLTIKPGETATDLNVPEGVWGVRLILITDTLGRRMYLGEVPYQGGTDLNLDVSLIPGTNRVQVTVNSANK